MGSKMSELSEAVATLVKHLKEDEGYRYSWQANIAMAFKDEFNRESESHGYPYRKERLHDVANTAAINFLNLLCREVK